MPTRTDQPRTVLVTGAAHGIGRATAELFLAGGWRVGMADIDERTVVDAAAGQPLAVARGLDVRDADQWSAVLAEFCGDDALDVLVNNAGVLASGPFTGMDLATHRRIVDVNLAGVIQGALLGHPYLQRAPRGMLVNLCSASALYGQPTLATYGATKAAVKSLTEALDLEWRSDGIRVRSLLPLFVSTDMVTRDGRAAASVAHLGVRLSAEDVAAAVWQVVHEGRRPLRSPHRAVGGQTRLLTAAAAVTPDWANRLVVGRLTR